MFKSKPVLKITGKSKRKAKKRKRRMEKEAKAVNGIFRSSKELASHESVKPVSAVDVLSAQVVKPRKAAKPEKDLSSLRLKEKKDLLKDLPARPEVTITFMDMGFDVYKCNLKVAGGREKQTILDNVSGVFGSKQLTGIMGPSGAGKSTLLNIISGCRESNVRGKVLLNGQQVNTALLRKTACYIMQEDELMPFLSVDEYMAMSAKLKLGSSADGEKKKRIIHAILSILRLEDCLDTRVHNLSGGEKKRLAIALELVSNPAIIFLDEPTSGLDSANCTYVVALLKNLASSGRTIVCTIHQPPERVFFMFDKMMVLAKGGRFIFSDHPSKMIGFFKKFGYPCPSGHNPADFIAELAGESSWKDAPIDDFVKVTKAKIKMKLEQKQKAGSSAREDSARLIKAMRTTGYAASYLTQFRVLSVRTFKASLRDYATLQLRFYGAIFVGLLMGGTFWQVGSNSEKMLDNMGLIFFCVMFNGFAGMLPTLLTFPTEMNVFRREHLNYWYSMKLYYLATTIAFLPAQVFFPALYTTIVYFMSGQPYEANRFFMHTLIMVLVGLLTESYGLIFGSALAPQSAVYIAPISMTPFVVYGGFLISIKNLPDWFRWMGHVSFFRYGVEGAVKSVYGFERNLTCPYGFPRCVITHSSLIETMYGLDLPYETDVAVLIGLMLIARSSAFFVMWTKVKTSR